MVVARNWEKGRMRSYHLIGGVSVWEDEKGLEMEGGDSCRTRECANATELYT